ncbi:MAG: DUF2723 domain-containing protein [bacterium]|nr:DUF2723 domain-containing protein [bacterium]
MHGRKLAVILAGAVAFLMPFGIYLATLSPTLNFWDCGEFITTSYILGIPHPPATPMYILVGRLVSILPFGLGVAHRINIMSAFFASLASMMMYLLVLKGTVNWRGIGERDDTRGSGVDLALALRIVGGLVAALFIAFSDTFWVNAIEAEVYSLSAFIMGLTVWLVLDWSEHAHKKRGNALVYLILYLLSLAVGFHLGTILVFPGFFVMALMLRKKNFSNLELWLIGLALALFLGSAILHMSDAIMVVGLVAVVGAALFLWKEKGRVFVLSALGLFVLGLSVHIFLLIRAGQNPIINEADPSTWKSLWAVLKREQYPFQLPTERKADMGWQFMHFFRYFGEQFRMPFSQQASMGQFTLSLGKALTAIPIGLGLLGIWSQFKQNKRHWAALITILLINSIGLVFFLNFSDSEVRERDYFYANGFYFFAIFIGLGVVGLMKLLLEEQRGRLLAMCAAPLLLLSACGPLAYHWETHDRSENQIARDYAYNMLAPLEENAVIFTNGDNDTFPLWYIQEVEGFRKDVRVVNLSLLNTDWYSRQLRDYEPRLPLSMSDEQLAEVITHYYRAQDGRIIQPRDEIINHLFVNAQRLPDGWDSLPFYFAVTVPRETLKPYENFLKMEGMAYRMTLTEGKDQVDIDKLRHNLEHVFEWRGILTEGNSTVEGFWREGDGAVPQTIFNQVGSPDDAELALPDFYKDQTTVYLIQNYAAAWSRLAIEMDRGRNGVEQDSELAVRSMEMAQLIREDLAPVVLYMGYLYTRNGEPERAMATYMKFLEQDSTNVQLWARYAQACEAAEKNEEVISALQRVIKLDPDYEPAVISLADYIIGYYPTEENLQYITRLLENYLRRHPDSPPARDRLEILQGADTAPPAGEDG